jgi:hypothetical protein
MGKIKLSTQLKTEYANRLVKCRQWRWIDGMAWIAIDAETGEVFEGRDWESPPHNPSVFKDTVPDLDDYATQSIILTISGQ